MEPDTRDMVKALVQGAVAQAGYYLWDVVEARQTARRERYANAQQRALDEIEGPIHPLAPKYLLPAVQNAVLEDDDYLQTQWIYLIANAAAGETVNPHLATFIGILKQLTPNEARLLNHLYSRRTVPEHVTADGLVIIGGIDTLGRAYSEIRTPPFPEQTEAIGSHPSEEDIETFIREGEEIRVVADNLMRLRLVSQRQAPDSGAGYLMIEGSEDPVDKYYLTTLAMWFLGAVFRDTAPQAKMPMRRRDKA